MTAGLTRIDGAVHVWSKDAVAFPWAPHDGHELPQVDGDSTDLLDTLEAHGFQGAVCVQPRVYGYDHGYLVAALRSHPGRLAGVGLVNPVRASGPEELRHLVEDLGMAGVRLLPLAQRQPTWFTDTTGDALWAAARDLRIPVSVLVRPEQLDLVSSRARQFPELTVVIDHLGSLPTDDTVPLRALTDLATHPNVVVKISALGFFATQCSAERLDDIALGARRAFGAERVVFGTDWPYALENGPWRGELNLLERALGALADADGLLGANAARLWGLDQPRRTP